MEWLNWMVRIVRIGRSGKSSVPLADAHSEKAVEFDKLDSLRGWRCSGERKGHGNV